MIAACIPTLKPALETIYDYVKRIKTMKSLYAQTSEDNQSLELTCRPGVTAKGRRYSERQGPVSGWYS